MLINTFSIVIGTAACDAKCPYCVSRQTGLKPAKSRHRVLSRHQNFQAALRMTGCDGNTNLLFTGKGEPTLYPDEITHFLNALQGSNLGTKELQTNGISIGRSLHTKGSRSDQMICKHLPSWAACGLNTIALSVVGVRNEQNARIFNSNYPPLEETVRHLRRQGFTIRLSVMMLKNYVDSPDTLTEIVEWAREHDVAQVTARPIRSAWHPKDKGASQFVKEHGLSEHEESIITEHFSRNTKQNGFKLSHGATIYIYRGVNLCLTDCLTLPQDVDHIRTLIYYASTGQLDYDWTEGSTLLSGIYQEKDE